MAALGVQAAAGVGCPRRRPVPAGGGPWALDLSAAGAIPPVLSLGLFGWVFAVGGSSNVAQMAAGGGLGLWQVWFHAWPVLVLGNAAAGLVHLCPLASPPGPVTDGRSFLARAAGLVAAGAALATTVGLAPDA